MVVKQSIGSHGNLPRALMESQGFLGPCHTPLLWKFSSGYAWNTKTFRPGSSSCYLPAISRTSRQHGHGPSWKYSVMCPQKVHTASAQKPWETSFGVKPQLSCFHPWKNSNISISCYALKTCWEKFWNVMKNNVFQDTHNEEGNFCLCDC